MIMAELSKGALYVITVEIMDPPEADDETREGIMRSLQGAVRRLSGTGATHGKDLDLLPGACQIMRFSINTDGE